MDNPNIKILLYKKKHYSTLFMPKQKTFPNFILILTSIKILQDKDFIGIFFFFWVDKALFFIIHKKLNELEAHASKS